VQVELLLKASLGVFGLGECGHGSFELTPAGLADGHDWSLSQPFNDPQNTFCHEGHSFFQSVKDANLFRISCIVRRDADGQIQIQRHFVAPLC
jgi:hypothetical protein